MAKRNGPKIVMVGGGSYNWCPRLISDMLHEPALDGAEVVLLDPNLKAAKEVAAAGAKMTRTRRRHLTFVPTTSESSAFRNADFALITISTGGLDMMEHDIRIPEKYGIFATVGDTVGPGGWSRSLRNIPVFRDMAEKIERLAPRAVVLNYTNPMATLTGAFYTVSSLRAVGLCHGLFGTYRLLEKLFGVAEKDLSVNFAGLNHFFWVLDFAVKGQPGYPMLRKVLGSRSIDKALAAGDKDEIGFHSNHALLDECWREYGLLGYAGDRHTCEFMPGYLTPEESRLERFKLARTSIQQRRDRHARARQHCLDLAAGKIKPYPRSRETAVDIMRAFVTHRAFVDVVNLPNIGQVDNLPRGAVVETLGVVDGLGFRPVSAGNIPPVIQGLLETHCNVQLMTLEAALTGDKELALRALMADPICAHLAPSEIRKMGLDLMDATKEWLPQFK